MAVYVDNYNAPYKHMIMCHMIADTDQELYEMVDKIKVNRKWKHNNHYDICLSKKKLAIKNNAIEITLDEIAKITHLRKMRKHHKIKPVLLSGDLNKLRTIKNYYTDEKQRIKNEAKHK